MALIKWDPFDEIISLQDKIERVFEDSLRAMGGIKRREEMAKPIWAPLVDIYETPDSVVVKAELPGIKPEEVDVQLSGDVLTIKGERKQEKEEKGKHFHRIERAYGSFQRSFTIGVPVKEKEIKATYKDGLLEITLPKAEEVKPKQIKIKVE